MNITIPKMSERTIVLPGKKELIKGLLLTALAGAQLPGMAPLGAAYAAAAFPAESAYIALAGLCAGTALAKMPVIKYVLAFFIYYIYVAARKTDDKDVRSVALGVATALAGLINFFFTGFTTTAAILLVPEAILSGCAYRLFTHEGEGGAEGCFADLLVIGGVFNSLISVVLPYINLNIAVLGAFFAVMCIAYACDIAESALAGLLIGFVMYMNTPECVFMAGMFACSAMIGSCMSGMGKTGAACGMICGFTICVLYNGGMGDFQIIDLFVPMAIYLLLPEYAHQKIKRVIERRMEPDYAAAAGGRLAEQLRTVAKAVCGLADGVTFTPSQRSSDADKKEVFGMVTSRVCRGCHLEKSCFAADNRKTQENMDQIWNIMEEDGFCNHVNMPQSFGQVCLRSETFLTEFRHAYELCKQNALYRGEALSERDIVARQYGEISNIINMLSHEAEAGCKKHESNAKYDVKVSVQQEPKQGQEVCGDTLIHFGKNGKYYVILCDGMGCGETAYSESRLTARLFEEFLKAGFGKETAVDMINSALALKADKESFSTVDLLEIDLESGMCEFLKIGSAPSFIKTKDGIDTVISRALPIGILESVQVTTEMRRVKNGDEILMISDGIGEAGCGIMKNEWIKKLLEIGNNDDNELTKLIMIGAKTRTMFSDDLTCVHIRIVKGGN